MADKPVRKPLPLLNFVTNDKLTAAIDEYWHANKLKSRAEAIRQLIERGLEQAQK